MGMGMSFPSSTMATVLRQEKNEKFPKLFNEWYIRIYGGKLGIRQISIALMGKRK